jgi:hypothetical protein
MNYPRPILIASNGEVVLSALGVGLACQPMQSEPDGFATGHASSEIAEVSPLPRAHSHARFSVPPLTSPLPTLSAGTIPDIPSRDSSNPKNSAINALAAVLDPSELACATLNAPGADERALLRAVASLARFHTRLGYGPLLLFLSQEPGAETHAHGLLGSPFAPPSVLLEGWRTATRRASHLARTVDVQPVNLARGGIEGWLRYSARSIPSADLGLASVATGDFADPWADALRFATIANPARCAWCLAPLASQRVSHGAQYCPRKASSCLESASRARDRLATVADPSETQAPGQETGLYGQEPAEEAKKERGSALSWLDSAGEEAKTEIKPAEERQEEKPTGQTANLEAEKPDPFLAHRVGAKFAKNYSRKGAR